jgi:DedD protein
MARRGSRGDRVLESRHLIGLFVGVVILCAVFFSLGYVMGRSQYSGSVQAAYLPRHAATPAINREKVEPKEAAPAPGGEWDFYANKNNNQLEKPAPAPAPSKILPAPSEAPAIAATRPAANPSSAMPKAVLRPTRANVSKAAVPGNTIVLQVAAVTRQGDAVAMAEALQHKKFAAFVVPPSTDNLYRVQVGPYPDDRAAENAQSALDRAGFKAIIKH